MLEAMKADGVIPVLMTYNSLMDGYGEAGQYKKMMDMFITIRKRGLIPNVISYTILIHHYGKAGEVEKALEIANIMAKEGRNPNSAMYTALVSSPFFLFYYFTYSYVNYLTTHKISALGQNGRAKEALLALHKMIGLGLPPNIRTFGAVIQSLVANGLLDDALGVIKLMQQSRVPVDSGYVVSILQKTKIIKAKQVAKS